MRSLAVLLALASLSPAQVKDSSPLLEKAGYLQRDLTDKHLLEGLYVSIVPSVPPSVKLRHTVDEPGNVIHAGVWTGRYLAGVGYQYAVTRDPAVRRHGGQILAGLRTLQEVTGKPGLLARGFVRGHGPVEQFERDGNDSAEWHQGQGKFADYRFYSDVSVDNFNAVLYGYAIYYDLAADEAQKGIIARDVDRLMTHLLDNHCRIIDLDGEVTRYGHVGIDPDPAFEPYYRKFYAPMLARLNLTDKPWRPSLRSSLMLLPDLLIAWHITGKERYIEFYRRVVEAYRANPDLARDTRPYSLERVARVNHSSEGQAYEALFNLIGYERDAALLEIYRQWVSDLWEMNWMEGNSLYTFMTVKLLPKPSHKEESLRLAVETLKLYPVERVFRPVMNSIRKDMEPNPYADRAGEKQAARPIPINQRPLDNEYAWKGNPYQMDGWLKPAVTAFQVSCDDPQVAWFSDSTGRAYMTRDGWKHWRRVSEGLTGARVRNLAASDKRTLVLYAQTDKGVFVTRDGGLSWRSGEAPAFSSPDFSRWQRISDERMVRVRDHELRLSRDGGNTDEAAMQGWRIPRAGWVFVTPLGAVAGGPGGAYRSSDGEKWTEIKLWPEEETGAADYLHAYWMGRYYGWIK